MQRISYGKNLLDFKLKTSLKNRMSERSEFTVLEVFDLEIKNFCSQIFVLEGFSKFEAR